MKQTTPGLTLNAARRPLLPQNWRRPLCLACGLAAALPLAALLLWPAARNGGLLLCNRLFAASEAVNAYAYDYFVLPEQTRALPAVLLLGLLAAALFLLAALLPSRGMALIFLLCAAGVEIYFGVTPPPLLNVLLFTLLGLLLLGRRVLRTGGAYIAAAAAVLALTMALAPGVHPGLEAASERMRDRLDRVEQAVSLTSPQQQAQEAQKTRRENWLREQEAALDPDAAQDDQAYQHREELEQEISRPQRVNWLKAAALLLLIPILLLVPFAPFLLLDSRRRRAAKRRAAFDDPDAAAAIRAMFLHLMAWLESAGLADDNRLYSACGGDVERLLPSRLAARYPQAAALWQEAAYSGHPMTVEQRQAMAGILEEAEDAIYQSADRRTRFVMKYVRCLRV